MGIVTARQMGALAGEARFRLIPAIRAVTTCDATEASFLNRLSPSFHRHRGAVPVAASDSPADNNKKRNHGGHGNTVCI